MREQLSEYKYKRISIESFKNGLRLHFDSILLFNNDSFPSAFQLSVLSLEEFSKSYWIEHVYWSSITNTGFPDKDFEQKWLKILYFHPEKQSAFFGWGMEYDYSPKFIAFVRQRGLEEKKQIATYVGLDRNKKGIDVNSRVSIPTRITQKDSKQMISLMSDYLKDICKRKMIQEYYFDIEEKNYLITADLIARLDEWKYKSGIKSEKWYNEWIKKGHSQHAI
ncbi:MAG: AbiV family abortive infection protein [Bacteroidia bacterium]|nr:AbiV family abortive infection protein [Bacteroidia bacterium]